MFVKGLERNDQSQQRTFHRCFLPSFSTFSQTVSEGENSIDASYQVSDHLFKRFQRRRFLEIDQSETRIACGGHVC